MENKCVLCGDAIPKGKQICFLCETKSPGVKINGDVVNHPSHYESGKFECIDVMLETQGKESVKEFCICNAFKYLYRHRRKNGLEDIKKAVWYLNRYIELGEERQTGQEV